MKDCSSNADCPKFYESCVLLIVANAVDPTGAPDQLNKCIVNFYCRKNNNNEGDYHVGAGAAKRSIFG
jgi:hypothetical protein